MFFFLSKLFWLVVQPISLMLLLVLAGLVLVIFGRRRLAVAALVVAVGMFGMLSLTSLGYVLIQPLEDRFAVPALPENADAIIMLGGATISRISASRTTVALNGAGERLTTTLWLANQFPDARIVLSGGGGSLTEESESEAETALRFFRDMGIDADRLVLEDQSRNTIENAQFSRSLLSGGEGNIILVTSAFHMPRAVGLFRAQGVPVLPWPTDFRSTGAERLVPDLADLSRNLETSSIATREWIGLGVYWMTGQIDAWFPAP